MQSTVKTAMVIRWKLYQKEITELYCINKNKPEMQCNGQCHLAKQMRRIETDYEQSKRPFAPKHLKPIDFLLFCQSPAETPAFVNLFPDQILKGGLYRIIQSKFIVRKPFNPPRFFPFGNLA